MLKESLLRLSESSTAKKVITRAPVSRSLARRFVAGDTLEDAVEAARALNAANLSVSLDFLGESVAADRIRAACEQAGSGSTTDIGSQIAATVAG